LYQKGFGYADIDNQIPYTPQHLQNIGSISKTFIGVSLQQAVDQGLLTWDTPINEVLPFQVIHPDYPDQPILLSHLASHTAGINDGDDYDFSYSLTESNTYTDSDLDPDDVAEFEVYAENPDYELGEFCRAFLHKDGQLYSSDHFLDTAPGEVYEYSNVGAALAAYVLEQASDMSFPQWTKTHILEPLSMSSSGWSFDEVDMSRHAQLYYDRSQPLPRYTLATYPDGGFITSVEDLSRYLSAMIANYGAEDNQLVKPGGLKAIMDNGVDDSDGGTYGYFWETQESGYIGHSGGDPGIITLMFFDPMTKYGFILFFNGYPSDDGTGINRILDLVTERVGQM
ncbi:MAG: serine hydrolase domain-containing protein, partial [Bacteroidota bacterium]